MQSAEQFNDSCCFPATCWHCSPLWCVLFGGIPLHIADAEHCFLRPSDVALLYVSARENGDCKGPLSVEQYRRVRCERGQLGLDFLIREKGKEMTVFQAAKQGEKRSKVTCDAAIPITRQLRLPSQAAIIARFGSWSRACCAAGLGSSSKARRWSPGQLARFGAPRYARTTLIAALADYFAEADMQQVKATFEGYSEWASRERRPSGGTIRARLLRDQTWPELVASVRKAALQASNELSKYWIGP